MKPIYLPDVFPHVTLDEIRDTTPWIKVTEARLECFMSASSETYTYGSGVGVRTYTPGPYSILVAVIQATLNTHVSDVLNEHPAMSGKYNVCFLNRYDNAAMQLGWHADDTPGMNHDHPIAVVSFGQPREIWWRENAQKGVIPPEQRQLLGHGSLFVMPPGMQRTHQHRIPKGDRPMSTRISLTYRNYVPPVAAP